MDLQKYVDGFGAMTCIVSVEKLANGKRGKFRIVTGNKAYIDSIIMPRFQDLYVGELEKNAQKQVDQFQHMMP